MAFKNRSRQKQYGSRKADGFTLYDSTTLRSTFLWFKRFTTSKVFFTRETRPHSYCCGLYSSHPNRYTAGPSNDTNAGTHPIPPNHNWSPQKEQRTRGPSCEMQTLSPLLHTRTTLPPNPSVRLNYPLPQRPRRPRRPQRPASAASAATTSTALARAAQVDRRVVGSG